MQTKMKKTSRRRCLSCKYSSTSGELTCNYYLDTKQRRGCPVGYCDKYEKGHSIRKFNGVEVICVTD